MFKNITLAFVCAFCVSFSAKAQFSLDDDSLFTDGYVASFTDMYAHTYIRNTTNDTDVIVWNRTLNALPTGNWSSAICDINTCYGPTVSSMEFELAPKAVGEISFHFYTGMDKGTGKMIVRFTRKSDPNYFIDVYVNCQAYGLGVSSLQKENFTVYPNPASTMITIGNSAIQEGTFEISNMLGEVVLTNSFSKLQKVDVSILPKGIYSIAIRNADAAASSKLVIE